MKKTITIMFLLTISYFINFSYVLAEETSKKENTCDYKAQAELNKIAANVTASYDIEKKEDGSNVFKISVYNITEKLFVSVLDEEEVFSLTITPAQLTNGVYTFEIANDTDVIRYNFTVRSLLEGCTGTIRKFSLVKPKRNKYHDYNECKFADTENYSYCQEWITKNFSLSESDILKKINEQRNGIKKITTAKCIECEESVRELAKKERIKLIKKIIVIVVSILIALDIIYIYIKTCHIKDSEI